eukprot:jgi/Mesen1/8671/ME000508S08050
MANLRLLYLLVTILALAPAPHVCADGELPLVTLGAILPYADSEDSAIPVQLANEWITALRIAIEMLNEKYATRFHVRPEVVNSGCDYDEAKVHAQTLVDRGVAGVVGPACSVAAQGAAEVLGAAGIPMISFAATADELTNKEKYPTFFRTVYGDRQQGAAITDVIKFFKFKRVYMFYSMDVYGVALSFDITRYLKELDPLPFVARVPIATDLAAADYGSLFSNHNLSNSTITNDTIIVIAALPLYADRIFQAALGLGYLDYPWWYLGSDGATCVDLVGEEGNYNPGSPFLPFVEYWKAKDFVEYPGLLSRAVTPRFNSTRPYVPYLIDAVWAFYDAFSYSAIVGEELNAANTVARFRNESNWHGFDGCTGHVQFDVKGERYKYEEGPGLSPQYEFVNLLGPTWEAKSTWKENQREAFSVNLTLVKQPGPLPQGTTTPTHAEAPDYNAPAPLLAAAPFDNFNFSTLASPTSSPTAVFSPPPPAAEGAKKEGGGGGGGTNGGAIAGIVLAVLLLGAIAAVGVWFYMKRQRQAKDGPQFVRML